VDRCLVQPILDNGPVVVDVNVYLRTISKIDDVNMVDLFITRIDVI